MLNGVKDKKNNELGDEIVVTEAMIAAGTRLLRASLGSETPLGSDYLLVEEIYRAMQRHSL